MGLMLVTIPLARLPAKDGLQVRQSGWETIDVSHVRLLGCPTAIGPFVHLLGCPTCPLSFGWMHIRLFELIILNGSLDSQVHSLSGSVSIY